MKKFALTLILIASSNANSTILFETDFEGGKVPYVQGAHPGGGYFSYLGGEIRNGNLNAGDGDDFYGSYNNVILDNSAAARNPAIGSNYSLKTQYKAGSAHSYQLNTSIIKFPQTDDFYIRWYQKWSKQFVWPNDQQKLIKIKGNGSTQNFPITGSENMIHLTYSPGGNGQVYVYSDWWGFQSAARVSDSIEGNGNFRLQTDRWYCLEMRVKSNTPGKNDAEFDYWIDDDLKFKLAGVNNRGSSSAGVDTVELQHVYQASSPPAFDQPTWMDNIVLSTQRIGCGGNSSQPSPTPAPVSPPVAPIVAVTP